MAIDKKRENERTNKKWEPDRETLNDRRGLQASNEEIERGRERERENWHADR